MRKPRRLATRMMVAQMVVIIVGASTLLTTAILITPRLFSDHLRMAGETDPMVEEHALQALADAFAVSLGIGLAASILAAGVMSWIIVRRIALPVEKLAAAAEEVAAGRYSVTVTELGFSSEMSRLFVSFNAMAAQLQRTQTTRTQLLADLSHELRTPIATLEAYVDGLEDGVLPGNSESWQTMRDQVDRMRRLASDIHLISVVEEGALGLNLSGVDPNDLARSAVAAATPSYLQKGVSLEYRGDQTTLEVSADPDRMRQVLANLLENALRHTHVGGRVGMVVSVSGGMVHMTLTDDGDGIASSELEAVFERFYRVDSSRSAGDGGGSGLGLTIARAIVADHGGELRASSEGVGKGSSFTITLPVLGPTFIKPS